MQIHVTPLSELVQNLEGMDHDGENTKQLTLFHIVWALLHAGQDCKCKSKTIGNAITCGIFIISYNYSISHFGKSTQTTKNT